MMFEVREGINIIQPEKGQCFYNCLKFFMENKNHEYNFKLVHGIIMGQGEIEGVWHSHGWMQLTVNGLKFAYDPTYDVLMLWQQYMGIAQCTDFKVYEYKDMANYVTLTGHAGPWEEKYDNLTTEGMAECEG